MLGWSIEVKRYQVGKIPAWHMAKLRNGGAYILGFDGGGGSCVGANTHAAPSRFNPQAAGPARLRIRRRRHTRL